MPIQNPPRRSAAAAQHLYDKLNQYLDEDAEFSRPRPPNMSQAGSAALTLYETQKQAWQKAKLLEQRKRERELQRALDGPTDLASVLMGGRPGQ